MKLLSSALLISAFIFSAFSTADIEGIKYKRYKYKSGFIEYKFTGDQTGSETLYFDDYGMKVAKYTNATLKFGKAVTPINKLDLIKNGYQFIIDLLTNTGNRTPDPTLNSLEEGEEHDLTKLEEETLIELGAMKIGTEVVAGKKCDVWEMPNINMKIWLWEGFTLRNTTKIPGLSEINLVAWDVKMDIPVPEDKFRIPLGANITEDDKDMKFDE